jgi:cbb3-type cytochrome oxidase subunit 3/L-fucose mutarotase/ribose pyranase (RbsD/FucU family)
MQLTFYLNAIVSYAFLWGAAFVFTGIVLCLLLYIFFFLGRHRKRERRKEAVRHQFIDLIAETAICETVPEIEETVETFQKTHDRLLQLPFARRILIQEMVKTKDSVSGRSAENLRFLFEKLELDKDCFVQFSSGQWHQKTLAIQQLAEMQQSKYLVKIYRETNNRNAFIRTEAQLAVVKLTGFKGLRFLSIVSYPLSQWQQLSLISQLQQSEAEEEKIKGWLSSKNETVTGFALRLVEVYKCYDLHEDVLRCLQHTSKAVRLQALHALKEIGNEDTISALLQHFSAGSREEQLLILDWLNEADAGSEVVRFLSSLLQHEDEAIRFRVMSAINRMSPVWSSEVFKKMKDDPSFTYILSMLPKKAV